MKKIFLLLPVLFISTSAFADDMICTINSIRGNITNGVSYGHIEGVEMVDLSKDNGEKSNFVMKKDGTLLKHVNYSDIVYEKPADKLGDVDGAVFISLNRDQGSKQGINVTMGTIHNNQKFASFEVETSSPTDEITARYLTKAVEIHCQPPRN